MSRKRNTKQEPMSTAPKAAASLELDVDGLVEIRMVGREPFEADLVAIQLRLEEIDDRTKNAKNNGAYIKEVQQLVAELSGAEPCSPSQAYWFYAQIRKQFLLFQKKTFGDLLAEPRSPSGSQESTPAD